MIYKFPRIVMKYLSWQKRDMLLSLIGFLILCSFFNSLNVIVSTTERIENRNFVSGYPSVLAIKGIQWHQTDTFSQSILALDSRIESVYPITSFADDDIAYLDQVAVISRYNEWATEYNIGAEHYALSEDVLQEFLLDSGIFTLVGNATLDENTVLVSEGTMLRHGLEVGGNITLYRNFYAWNTTSDDDYRTNASLTLRVNGYLRLEKPYAGESIFRTVFNNYNIYSETVLEKFNECNNKKKRDYIDFVFYNLSSFTSIQKKLLIDSRTGFVNNIFYPYSESDWEPHLAVNYFLNVKDLPELLENHQSQEIMIELSSLSQKLEGQLQIAGNYNVDVLVLWEEDFYKLTATLNTLVLIIIYSTIPILLVSIYFLKTTVSLKQGFRRDLVALLKRKGIADRQIGLLFSFEELILGVITGIFALIPGILIAQIWMAQLYPGEAIDLVIGDSYLLWSISASLFLTVISALFSYRSLSGITSLKYQLREERDTESHSILFDRLDYLILFAGTVPFVALLLLLIGIDIPILHIFYSIMCLPFIVFSPFLLSYSLVRFLLVKTSFINSLMSGTAKMLSSSQQFLIKASMAVNKTRIMQILFLTSFAVSIAVYPGNIIETTRMQAYSVIRQDIGADISIEIPGKSWNSSIEGLISSYDFVESITTIIKIDGWYMDTIYRIHGIDPVTYINTVSRKAIEENGATMQDIEELQGAKALYQEDLSRKLFVPLNTNITYSNEEVRLGNIPVPDFTFSNIGMFKSLPGILPLISEYRKYLNPIYDEKAVYITCNSDYLSQFLNETILTSKIVNQKVLVKLKQENINYESLKSIEQILASDFGFERIRSALVEEHDYMDQLSILFRSIYTIIDFSNIVLVIIGIIVTGLVLVQLFWKQLPVHRIYQSRGIGLTDHFKIVFSEYWSQVAVGTCLGFIFGIVVGIGMTHALLDHAEVDNPLLHAAAFSVTLVTVGQLEFLAIILFVLSIITFILALVSVNSTSNLTSSDSLL